MNKLDRFRFGGVHKRRMKVGGITALSVFVVGLGLLAVVGVFGSRSENVRITLNEQTSGVTMEGTGINLTSIPSSNRLNNFDFESSLRSQSYTISGADNSYLYFESDSNISNQQIMSGDDVDVYSLDSNGVMNLKFTGTVDSISASRFGMNNLIVDVNALWFNDAITKTAISDNVVDAITEEGKLIADISGECSLAVDSDMFFVDICSAGQNVYALSREGEIYFSADGRSFSFLRKMNSEDSFVNIAAVGSTVSVTTSGGDYLILSNGRETKVPLKFDAENSLMISNGSRVVMCSGDAILSSMNGYYFNNITLQTRLLRSWNFVSASAVPGMIVLLNDQGQIFVIPDEGMGYVADMSSISPEQVACATDSSIILKSSEGKAYLVMPDRSLVDLTTDTASLDSVFTGATGRIIARSGNNLYMDRVLSGLHIVETVPGETVIPGDICVISSSSNDFYRSWEPYGENTMINSSKENYGKCLVLNGTDDGVHAVYQRLYGVSEDNFSENTFYRIELKVKGSIDGNLKVWVSGEDITEGFETQVTDKFEKVSYVFAVTDSMLNNDDIVRLNISFEGEGQVFIDDVYLGEDKYEISDIPSSYVDAVKQSHPATIRLPELMIGGNGFSKACFYGMNEESLENSMRLVRDANSCPWFVIGSDVKQSDINEFLEYLCGSVSTEYGKLRTDNGTALPWNRQFDRIYIEIDDDIGAYLSDVQKGAYVSYVISLFRQSENYIDVRDKIVFIDGMHYDGGTVLSSADYHASALSLDLTGEEVTDKTYLGFVRGSITDFISESPRVALHMGNGGEYISSLSFDVNDGEILNAAQLVSLFLNDDAESIKMCLFDMDISDRPVDTESDKVFSDASTLCLLKMIDSMSFIRNTEGMYYVVEDPLSASSTDSAEAFSQSCSVVYVTGKAERYLVVANASDTQQQFITEGINMIANGTTIRRYSSNGKVLFDRSVKRTDVRFTLQPGEIIVFTIPNE